MKLNLGEKVGFISYGFSIDNSDKNCASRRAVLENNVNAIGKLNADIK